MSPRALPRLNQLPRDQLLVNARRHLTIVREVMVKIFSLLRLLLRSSGILSFRMGLQMILIWPLTQLHLETGPIGFRAAPRIARKLELVSW